MSMDHDIERSHYSLIVIFMAHVFAFSHILSATVHPFRVIPGELTDDDLISSQHPARLHSNIAPYPFFVGKQADIIRTELFRLPLTL